VVVYGGYSLLSEDFDVSEAENVSVEITARVMFLERGVRTPELSVKGPMSDLAGLQLRLAWAVLHAVNRDSKTEAEFLKSHKAVRLDAMESYVRGLMAPNPEQKHRLFTQAARLEPDYGGPNFELGMLSWDRKGYRAAAGWFGHVPKSCGYFADAQFLLGVSLYRLADYQGALQAFERAAAVAPSSEVENNLGAVDSRLKRTGAAEHFRKSIELDPKDADYRFNLGYVLWKQDKFEEAERQFQEALRLKAGDAEAATMRGRSQKRIGPRPADSRSEGQERLKETPPPRRRIGLLSSARADSVGD
jgi:tetratricopeptide (TPR) repeat protein